MSWLGCTRQCKKNRKQHHIQNQSKFLPWYLINGLECTVQNILISLNTLFELHMKSKKQVKYQQNLLLKKEKLSPLKYSNVNIGFSQFYAQRPKWCVLTGSKMTHSICVCSADQNVVLLVDAMNGDVTYKDLIKLTLS